MSTIRTILLALMTVTVSMPVGSEEPGPGLGQPASAKLIESWNLSVFADGRGLPQGSGTVAEGRKLYNQQCVACHAERGAGGSADRLANAEMGLTDEYPQKTIANYWPYATTLFDFIRRSMPMHDPGSLNNDEVYAVTAYLLSLDDVIAKDAVLNRDSLLKVDMPNEDGFINIWQQPTPSSR